MEEILRELEEKEEDEDEMVKTRRLSMRETWKEGKGCCQEIKEKRNKMKWQNCKSFDN